MSYDLYPVRYDDINAFTCEPDMFDSFDHNVYFLVTYVVVHIKINILLYIIHIVFTNKTS